MLQKLSSWVLITAGLFCSVSVHAATYSLGTLVPGDNEFGVYSVNPSSFADRINFDIGSLGSLSAGVGSIKVTVGLTVKRDISNLALQVYDDANHLLPTALGSTLTNLTLASALPAGHYYALITGLATGTLGGKYGGVFTLSPAPEPETWAMMAVGMGMLKLVSRRKKRSASDNLAVIV